MLVLFICGKNKDLVKTCRSLTGENKNKNKNKKTGLL